MGAAGNRQAMRMRQARMFGAYHVSASAAHGYARFTEVAGAEHLAALLLGAGHCTVHVYEICHDVVAVDWEDRPRLTGNHNIVR